MSLQKHIVLGLPVKRGQGEGAVPQKALRDYAGALTALDVRVDVLETGGGFSRAKLRFVA